MPTLTLQPDEAASKDSHSDDFEGHLNGAFLRVRAAPEGNSRIRIQFDLSSIPAGAVVSSATLTLEQIFIQSPGTWPITLGRATTAWSETSGFYNDGEVAEGIATNTRASLGSQDFDVASIVQGWVDGTNVNHGFHLEKRTTGTGWDAQYASSGAVTAAHHPKLVVTYTTNVAPNAPGLSSPANGALLPFNRAIPFVHSFSDPDAGDTQSAYALRATRVPDGLQRWWNGSSWVTTETFVSSASQNNPATPPAEFYGKSFDWAVATKDAAGLQGPYSGSRRIHPAFEGMGDAL